MTHLNMEALLSQFSFLADQACHDKSFDPARIDELMKLFELEAYNSWAAMEAEDRAAVEDAELSMKQAEEYLDSLMDSAMEEYESFSKEMDRRSKKELEKLVSSAEAEKKKADSLGNGMTMAAKKYMDSALLSATGSMKSAWNGLSKTSKVHPS